jgi:flagellar biosynthesis/type III secretory pathway protein FliH
MTMNRVAAPYAGLELMALTARQKELADKVADLMKERVKLEAEADRLKQLVLQRKVPGVQIARVKQQVAKINKPLRAAQAEMLQIQHALEKGIMQEDIDALQYELQEGRTAGYNYDRTRTEDEIDWEELAKTADRLAKDAKTLTESVSQKNLWRARRDLSNIYVALQVAEARV